MTDSAPKKDQKDQKKKDAKQDEDLVILPLSRVSKTRNSRKRSTVTASVLWRMI